MRKILNMNFKLPLIIQFIGIALWLLCLGKTDSYYSVYIICALFGVFSLVKNTVNEPLSKKSNILVVTCSCFFSVAIALANYKIFSETQNLIILPFVLLGGAFLCYNILWLLCSKGETQEKEFSQPKKPWLCFLIVFSSILIIDLIYLFFVAYPGYLSPDSLTQVSQILEGSYTNHHPFWHTMVIGIFLKTGLAVFGEINAAVAFYSVFLIVFMACSFAYAVLTLYQSGVKKIWLVICSCIYILSPYNIAYSVTMWKDVVFGGAAILLIVSIYRIIKKISRRIVWDYIVLAFSALAFCLWRTNGWLALVAAFVVFVFILRKTRIKMLVVVLAALILSWFMRSPLLSILNVPQPHFVESLSIPVQQIGRVISEGKELNQEQTEFLSKIMDIEEVPSIYANYISDPMKYEIIEKGGDYLEKNKIEFFKVWLSLAFKYPSQYINAWVDQTKGYWGGGYEYGIYPEGCHPNAFGIANTIEDNFIKDCWLLYSKFFHGNVAAQPFRSIAPHIWAVVAVFITCIVNKRKEWLLTVPIIAVVLTLLIATPVFSEFRYAYTVFTTIPFLLAVTFGIQNEKKVKRAE